MEQWIEAQDFIAADVIRWKEGVYHNRRKGKALRIGERQVAAEVLHRGEDGWVKLLVRGCTITKDEAAGKAVQALKAGEQIRRAIKTLLRGKVERLLWDDETARMAVVNGASRGSRYIKKEVED